MSAENFDFDIVIVGAGAAGVGAARRLTTSGLSCVLFEATARIGGRAWSCDISGLGLDLGCGWLHSANRNVWVGVADALGFAIDRRPPAWGTQFRDLGFSAAEQTAAKRAYTDWGRRLVSAPPASDCAADVLEPDEAWNTYIETMSGFITGAELRNLSAADYIAYDSASTRENWRVVAGYGALVAAAAPPSFDVRFSTPVESIALTPKGVAVKTSRGTARARSVIVTASTAVIAAGTIGLPAELNQSQDAASRLPLGLNEKLFFEITREGFFETETRVLGKPRDHQTGVYYIGPLDRPVVECFLGNAGARIVMDEGIVAGYVHAIDELVGLFGADVRRYLRPLVGTNWSRQQYIGGSYSYALPGYSEARQQLARPFDQRLFFAGEATHAFDYSTAHGAYDSGVRAAELAISSLSPKQR